MTAKCKLCGNLYQQIGFPFCNKCMREMDDKYRKVRDYLYDNTDATIEEVAEGTGVDERTIVYFLKDGRLQMKNASGVLRCEQCGASIKTGRLCAECIRKLGQKLDSLNPKKEEPIKKAYERDRKEVDSYMHIGYKPEDKK